MSQTLIGMYNDFGTARQVVEELVNAGFSRDSISLIANDTSTKYGETLKSDRVGGADGDVEAPEGAGFGAVVGTLIGLGSALIPGVGPIIAGGTLGAAALSAGLGALAGAVTGGLSASLIDLGIPEDDATAYAEGIRRGGAIVSVTTDESRTQQAHDIMNRFNPSDLTEESTWSADTESGFDADKFQAIDTTGMDVNEQAKFKVVQEELQVGKREVERGTARVRSYVVETPVQEQVTLREEHIKIDRRPVDRPATGADLNAFQEGVIEVTETAEQPVVSKQARVVEEVVVGKEVTEHTETINDTVRRVDVDIEEHEIDTSRRNFDSYDFRPHYDRMYMNSGYTYDQYLPAYRYGYDLRNSNRYRNARWEDVEMDIRRDWEEKNPSTWEKFKDAIREAWNSITD